MSYNRIRPVVEPRVALLVPGVDTLEAIVGPVGFDEEGGYHFATFF
jgi:hypothetical protein